MSTTALPPLDDQTEALRHGAGAFRSGRDVVAVRGPDAEAYLQGQLSQDVAALAVGATADSLLLEPDGKLSALLRVTRTDGQGFVLDVDRGYGDAVVARLRRFLLRSKVELEPLAWRDLSLRGAGVEAAAAGLLTVLAERGVLALPFEWNGWTGVDLLGPRGRGAGARRRRVARAASPPAAPRRSRPAASSRVSPPWEPSSPARPSPPRRAWWSAR